MRTKLSCGKHHYSAKAPIGNHITDCPFCLIEEIEQHQKEIKKKLIILRKWIKEMV